MKSSPITAWSYSRYDVYRKCPRQFKFKHIDKRPEPPSPAMARGQEAHTTLETFIKVKVNPPALPPYLKQHKAALTGMKRRGAEAELELGLTRKWEVTGWFEKDVWLRVKIDLIVPTLGLGDWPAGSVDAIDYKTGRVKPEEHAEQLELYGLGVRVARPAVPAVRTGAWYVDHEKAPRYLGLYPDRTDLPSMKKSWENKVAALFKDRAFRPNPGAACKWCAFSRLKGGPCDAG